MVFDIWAMLNDMKQLTGDSGLAIELASLLVEATFSPVSEGKHMR